jgi:hypothetical protein
MKTDPYTLRVLANFVVDSEGGFSSKSTSSLEI